MAENYLPLTEYSSKYKVSISTLRRRIKADDIKYVFEDGKYLIMDEPVGVHQKVHRPSQSSEQTFLSQQPTVKSLPPTPTVNGASAASRVAELSALMANPSFREVPVPQEAASPVNPNWHAEIKDLGVTKAGQEPILTAANRLLTELKRAYTQVLQEKEEQILHLKEEISDLKTLVRALEADNDRRRR